MFEHNIWRCGAVDVADDSGLVRRGMIRDLVPSQGLIIDFGYPDHHADLIPFIQCSILPRKDPFYAGDAVETLFRCSVSAPWCWYPSKLLAGSWDTYAFVEISADRGIIREVVSVERVRPATSGTFLPGDDEYYKHSVELCTIPLAEDIIKSEKFLEMWNRATGTVGVTIEEGKLEYVSMRAEPLADVECYSGFPPDSITLRLQFKLVNGQWVRSSSRGRKRNAAGEVILVNGEHSVEQQDSTPDAVMQTHATVEDVCINNYLPQVVLHEIFRLLDVATQIKCRKVSRSWNSVLDAPWTSLHVQIDLTACDSQKLASVLHRMVTASTRVLVLTGWARSRQGTSWRYIIRTDKRDTQCRMAIRTVMDMLQIMDIKVPMIAISRRNVYADELIDFSGPEVTIQAEWQLVCRHLTVHNTAMYGLLAAHWPDFEAREPFKLIKELLRHTNCWDLVLPVEKGITDVQGETGAVDLLDCLETSCSGTLDGFVESLLDLYSHDTARAC